MTSPVVEDAAPETMSLTKLVREVAIAVAMITLLIGGLFLHTGTMPPLVVVESSSMVHDETGEIGSIDAGDLILVHGRDPAGIVTFAEATHVGHPNFGHASHGMEGDVVIYEKNGEAGTPIIHRAILRVVANATSTPDRAALSEAGHAMGETHSEEPTDALACPEGGVWDPTLRDEDGAMGTCVVSWDVPGTPVRNQSTVSIQFDGVEAGYYDCKRPAHGNAEAHLVVHEWQPTHEGLLTLGDANRCSVDQGPGATNGSAGVHGQGGGGGSHPNGLGHRPCWSRNPMAWNPEVGLVIKRSGRRVRSQFVVCRIVRGHWSHPCPPVGRGPYGPQDILTLSRA